MATRVGTSAKLWSAIDVQPLDFQQAWREIKRGARAEFEAGRGPITAQQVHLAAMALKEHTAVGAKFTTPRELALLPIEAKQEAARLMKRVARPLTVSAQLMAQIRCALSKPDGG